MKRTVSSKSYKLNPKRNADPIFNDMVDSFANFLFQSTYFISSPYFGVFSSSLTRRIGTDTMYIRDELFNLQNDGDIYSTKKFLEILKGLKPKPNDPLYTPTSKIYSIDEQISISSEDDNFWLKLFSRFSIDDNGALNPNLVDDIEFYNSWLLVMQNEILRGNPSDLFSDDEVELLFHVVDKENVDTYIPKSIDTTASSDENFQMINNLKEIMLHKFGFTMYFFIISGIASFRFDDRIYIDYLALQPGQLHDILVLFNIKPISTMKNIKSPYTDYSIDYSELYSIIFHSLMYGYSQVIDGRVMKISSSKNAGILNRMFKKLDLNKFSNTYYQQIYKLFKNQYYSKITDPRNIIKKQTIGREKISAFVKGFALKLVKNIFSNSREIEGLDSNYEDTWERRTEQQICSIIDMYVDNPTADVSEFTNDIVKEIRLALSQHRNAKIIIRSTGGSSRIAAFASNPLIYRGLTIEIPYSDLKSLMDDDVRLALLYTNNAGQAVEIGRLSTILDINNQIKRMGWFLDVNIAIDEVIKGKILDAYKVIHDILSKAKDKDGDWLRDSFRVRCLVQNGGGFTDSANFKASYGKSLGFTDYIFEFDPSDPNEFNNAIASIIFYLFAVKDSTIIVSAGNRINFLSLDILGFYRDSDFEASLFGSHNINLELVWGKETKGKFYDHLTPEEYNTFGDKFRECFNLKDLRLFTAFSNMIGSDGQILQYIWMRIFKPLFERQLSSKYHNKVFEIFDISRHDLNQAITLADQAQS